MKLLGSILIGLLLLGGGYWWWSSRPTEPLAFENTRPLEIPSKEEESSVENNEPEPTPTPQPSTAPSSVPVPVETTPVSPAPSEPTLQPTIEIIPRLTGFGFRTPSNGRSIDTIVLHSSYNASGGDVYNLDKIIGQYEQYGVGAHYLIARDGKIYQLIRESNIAYHAGESKMPDGRKNVNDFSIGIEIVGTEDSGFTSKQYDAVNDLIADIKTRYRIEDIVGHGDIAPTRKTDPWKFDWKKLK